MSERSRVAGVVGGNEEIEDRGREGGRKKKADVGREGEKDGHFFQFHLVPLLSSCIGGSAALLCYLKERRGKVVLY
jgi:hypothetical protein